MFRSLLTPRWLLLHVLFVAATISTGFLAVWQWDRAHEAGGSFQNLGYALQWPVFGAFTIFLWIKLIRADLARARSEAATIGSERPGEVQESARLKPRARPLVPPPAAPVGADEDAELAAYNQYLAQLNEADKGAS